MNSNDHEYIIMLERLVFHGCEDPKDNGVWWMWQITDDSGDLVHVADKALKNVDDAFAAAKAYLQSEGMPV